MTDLLRFRPRRAPLAPALKDGALFGKITGMEDRSIVAGDDCVEPELLSPGSARPRGPEYGRPPLPPEKPGLLARLKGLLAAGLALTGAALFITGALLTSTVIGAVIGIPLLLLGAAAFFLLFKLLSLGATSKTFTFRRF